MPTEIPSFILVVIQETGIVGNQRPLRYVVPQELQNRPFSLWVERAEATPNSVLVWCAFAIEEGFPALIVMVFPLNTLNQSQQRFP